MPVSPTILSENDIEEIIAAKGKIPVFDIMKKYHIGYSRLYTIWGGPVRQRHTNNNILGRIVDIIDKSLKIPDKKFSKQKKNPEQNSNDNVINDSAAKILSITGGSDLLEKCQQCEHAQQYNDVLKNKNQQQQQDMDLLTSRIHELHSTLNIVQNKNFDLNEQLQQQLKSQSEYDKLSESYKQQSDEINSLKAQLNGMITKHDYDKLKVLNQRQLETNKLLKSEIEKLKNLPLETLVIPNQQELETVKEKLNEYIQREQENTKLITDFEDEVDRLELENKQLRNTLKEKFKR